MTTHRDLKRIIRERQKNTGEFYTGARAHVMREREALIRLDAAPRASARAEAVVLKVNRSSARVRFLGEQGGTTFRSTGTWNVAPGHLATLLVKRRWTFRGGAYASGRIESARVAVERLGLEPLPLRHDDPVDLRSVYEPYRSPDPYTPLWRRLTARPRPGVVMDPIAWGAFPGRDVEENRTCDAAELAEAGDLEGARRLLMEVLCKDLRCLDAHAHLGNLEFDRAPARALVHYEIGMRIGDLSLPPDFEGVLLWGHIYNRPYLRCLHGYGLCLWRLGRLTEARKVFERILSLNPNDNQGVRFCREDLRRGREWEEAALGEESPTVH